MSVFVEENDNVVTLHESGFVGRLGKVADQDVFWKAKALLAGRQSKRGVMLVFVFPWKHIEVNSADQFFLVINVIRGHFRMPDLGRSHGLISDAVHPAGDIENAL